ncbi:MAG: hypothetical protein HYU66_29085 [Armatimonadetes bacterium]|nr:hypothetical protein [Armatimonadota bacterium]
MSVSDPPPAAAFRRAVFIVLAVAAGVLAVTARGYQFPHRNLRAELLSLVICLALGVRWLSAHVRHRRRDLLRPCLGIFLVAFLIRVALLPATLAANLSLKPELAGWVDDDSLKHSFIVRSTRVLLGASDPALVDDLRASGRGAMPLFRWGRNDPTDWTNLLQYRAVLALFTCLTGYSVVATTIPMCALAACFIAQAYLLLVRFVDPRSARWLAAWMCFDPSRIALSHGLFKDFWCGISVYYVLEVVLQRCHADRGAADPDEGKAASLLLGAGVLTGGLVFAIGGTDLLKTSMMYVAPSWLLLVCVVLAVLERRRRDPQAPALTSWLVVPVACFWSLLARPESVAFLGLMVFYYLGRLAFQTLRPKVWTIAYFISLTGIASLTYHNPYHHVLNRYDAGLVANILATPMLKQAIAGFYSSNLMAMTTLPLALAWPVIGGLMICGAVLYGLGRLRFVPEILVAVMSWMLIQTATGNTLIFRYRLPMDPFMIAFAIEACRAVRRQGPAVRRAMLGLACFVATTLYSFNGLLILDLDILHERALPRPLPIILQTYLPGDRQDCQFPRSSQVDQPLARRS